MIAILIALNIIAAVFLIAVVLLQSGKGADMGAAFGGASTTVFGASGAGNLLTKLTAGSAAVFMLTSLALAVAGTRQHSVFDTYSEPAVSAPAAPAAPAASDNAGNGSDSGSAAAPAADSNDLGPAGQAGNPAAAAPSDPAGKIAGNPAGPAPQAPAGSPPLGAAGQSPTAPASTPPTNAPAGGAAQAR